MDLTKIDNIIIGGIDHSDHPDYVDSFIESCDLDGIEMNDEELDYLNENHADFVYDAVLNFIY
ncbi:MAG: hypothetical protein IH795_08760 [Bacteroidetes bacterium]|nr:hypothetical protein [Bacteroidota bacterium]